MNKQQILVGKKILILLCSLELGGAERQALHLARHLKSLDCDVRVWGLSHTGLVIEECKKADIPWAMHFFRWPCRKRSLVRVGLGFLRFLRALRRDPVDVIIAYTGWANVSAGLAWRWSKAKVCIWGQRDVDCLRGDFVERYAYRRVSAVICNAEHEIEYLHRKLGETPAPIKVVHNGLKLEPCRQTRAEWRAELGIDNRAVVVTMVANFRPEKDHMALLQAWSRLLAAIPERQPRPMLLLAGKPQESFQAAHNLANSLGLLDTVSFLGQVRDVSGLLAASDIGVLVSRYEGLSNALFEYMASGLPVAATDLPGNREVLGNDPRQFCSLGDVDGLADRLRMFLVDPDLRRELGELNRRRVKTHFSIEAMCEASSEIIANLLEETLHGD